MDNNAIINKVKKDKVKYILLQFSDIYGIVKSVTIPANHLESSLKYGTWFDGSSIEGFSRIAESDMYLKPDITTYAVIPWLLSDGGNSARIICDIYSPDGNPFEGDPRYILKKALNEAKKLGFEYKTGPEMEFFLLQNDNGLKALPHDRGGYFDMITDQAYEIRQDMAVALEKLGINVEATHHEVATGQHEIGFKYGDAMSSADSATTIKFTLKAIAQKHGLLATFMPKPITGENGSGMHVHQSLFSSKTGKNAFYDNSNEYKLSKTALSFIAGQLKHVNGMSAILSPTVNSYKRLTPGYEAPVYISWARTNRSSLIRIPRYSAGKPSSTRIELRNPDPSCNPYLAFAVMLMAGIDGIKNNLEPPLPVEEDVYNLSDKQLKKKHIGTLPDSLAAALTEMQKDPLILDTLGEHTYSRYIEAKNKEWDKYRLQVTEWEIDKYLKVY